MLYIQLFSIKKATLGCPPLSSMSACPPARVSRFALARGPWALIPTGTTSPVDG